MKTLAVKHARYGDSVTLTMQGGEIAPAASRGESDAFSVGFIETIHAAAQSLADRRQQLEEQRLAALAAVEVAGANRDKANSDLAKARATLFGRALDSELARGQALLAHAEAAHRDRRSDADDAAAGLKVLATEAATAVAEFVADAAEQLSADLAERMKELNVAMAHAVAGDLTAYITARGGVDELAEPRSRSKAVQQVLLGLGFDAGVNSLTTSPVK